MHNQSSVEPQRIPMLDASTLEDRTRPDAEPSPSVRLRLRYSGWPTRADRRAEARTLRQRIRSAGFVVR